MSSKSYLFATFTAVLTTVALLAGCQDSSYFKTCEQAREASAAPMEKGDPGYRVALDRNRDGVACEK